MAFKRSAVFIFPNFTNFYHRINPQSAHILTPNENLLSLILTRLGQFCEVMKSMGE